MRVAIVEDDREALRQMHGYLQRYSEESGEPVSIAPFESGLSFLKDYPSSYDVVFMDVEMPALNGIEVAREMRKLDSVAALIFVTNMAKYAINGYEVGALDYVLKPVFYSDLKMRMERLRPRIRRDTYSFTLPVQGGVRRFAADEVVYIESAAHTITFHTLEGDHTIRGPSMKELETRLTAHGFARCNTCYIVNLRFCRGVKGSVVDVNGQELQISRARKSEFMSALVDSFVS